MFNLCIVTLLFIMCTGSAHENNPVSPRKNLSICKSRTRLKRVACSPLLVNCKKKKWETSLAKSLPPVEDYNFSGAAFSLPASVHSVPTTGTLQDYQTGMDSGFHYMPIAGIGTQEAVVPFSPSHNSQILDDEILPDITDKEIEDLFAEFGSIPVQEQVLGEGIQQEGNVMMENSVSDFMRPLEQGFDLNYMAPLPLSLPGMSLPSYYSYTSSYTRPDMMHSRLANRAMFPGEEFDSGTARIAAVVASMYGSDSDQAKQGNLLGQHVSNPGWEREFLITTLRERQRTDSILLALLSNGNSSALQAQSIQLPIENTERVVAAGKMVSPETRINALVPEDLPQQPLVDQSVPKDKKRKKYEKVKEFVNQEGKRKYTRRQPVFDEFSDEEEYDRAWEKWRERRDRNNDNVKRTHLKKNSL